MQVLPESTLILDQADEIEDAYKVLFIAYESGHPYAQRVLKSLTFPRASNTEATIAVDFDVSNQDVLFGAARWLMDKNNLDKILKASDERGTIQAKYHSSAKDTNITPADLVTYYRARNLVQVCSAVRAAQLLLDLYGEQKW